MNKVTMNLDTLTCPSCIKKIGNGLGKTDGVSKVKVMYNLSKLKVNFDATKTTSVSLKQIVEDLGYSVLKYKES